MALTTTQIKYLIVIQSLNCGGIIRSADIAGFLGVSKPTVHSMLEQLSKLALIKKEKYSVLELTEHGESVAKLYADGFMSFSLLLSKRLNLPEKNADEGALAILGCLDSEELALHLRRCASEQ